MRWDKTPEHFLAFLHFACALIAFRVDGLFGTESEAALTALEKELRGQPTAVRVQMLRLLKSGQVASLAACAPLLGLVARNCNAGGPRIGMAGCQSCCSAGSPPASGPG